MTKNRNSGIGSWASYRIYFIQCGATLIVLLAGGDKRTQQQDITQAIELAQDL
jgi:putative addiction module killer protein